MRCRGLLGQGLKALEGERQVGSALGGDEGVNLVDDDGIDGAQCLGCLRGQQQVERLRGGDENVGWVACEPGALPLRRVAGPDADRRIVERHALAAGHVGDPGEG